MVFVDPDGIKDKAPINTDKNNLVTKDKTLCERLNNFRKLITVEPVAFLALFSSNFSSVTSQTLALQKACRVNLNLGDEICESLLKQNQSNDYSSYEKLVQEYYSSQVFWKSSLETFLTCFLLLFIGGWSDKTGRKKAVILLPILGGTLNALSNIINVFFFNQLPLQVQIFFEVLFVCGTGGFAVTMLGLSNYICDITTIKNRTHRIGIISLCTSLGIPLGSSMSGIIFKLYGYYVIYGLVLIIDVVNILYITYSMSNPPRSEEQMKYDGQGLMKFFITFFNLSTIRDTIKMVFKKTHNNRRIRLCMLLVSVIFVYGPINGEASILYMVTRYRFNWDEVKYSIFQTYKYVTAFMGTTFSIIVFSKYLRLHDSVMGITSCITRVAANFVFCFALNERIFFIGPVIDIFNATSMIAIKSMATKFVNSTEIGSFNSLLSLMENLTPLLYIPMYTKVYTLTMDSLPGASYLIGTSTAIVIFVFVWLLHDYKSDAQLEEDKAGT